MAAGRKTGGRDFKPGWKGGPGRPKVPKELREAYAEIAAMRGETRHVFSACFNEMRDWSEATLESFVKSKQATVVELMAARAMLKVITSTRVADVSQMHELMCGPEPKQVELSGPGGEPLNPLAKIPTSELVSTYHEVQRQIGERQCKSIQKPPPPSELSAPSFPPESDTEL